MARGFSSITITKDFHLNPTVYSCLWGNWTLLGGLTHYWLHCRTLIPLVVVLVFKWSLLSVNDDFWALLQIKLYLSGNQLRSFEINFCVLINLHMLIDANECHIFHMCLIQFFLKWVVIAFTHVIGLQHIINTN